MSISADPSCMPKAMAVRSLLIAKQFQLLSGAPTLLTRMTLFGSKFLERLTHLGVFGHVGVPKLDVAAFVAVVAINSEGDKESLGLAERRRTSLCSLVQRMSLSESL